MFVDGPTATREDFFGYFSHWANAKVLLATAWSWFTIDIAFYGLGLNSSIFIENITRGTHPAPTSVGENAYKDLLYISLGNIVIAVGGQLLGFLAAWHFIDKVRQSRSVYGF